MIRAGNLRHRIDIQESTDVPDGMGGSTLTWASVSGMGSVPAAIWPVSSKEILDAMKQELQITHKIRIRYRAGLTSKNRIVFGSRVFNIISIINADEKGRQIDILAIEDI